MNGGTKNKIVKSVYCCLAFLFLIISNKANAQDPSTLKNYWSELKLSEVSGGSERYILPKSYRLVRLDIPMLRSVLASSPMEFTVNANQSKVIISVPMPDGTFQQFRMVESQMMHPDLAGAYPTFKTYSGQGIDDPTAILIISLTDLGFHGMIRSSHGNYYIDPFHQFNTLDYIIYERNDLPEYQKFICSTDDFQKNNNKNSPAVNGINQRTNGTQLRKYRLALAATGEYSAFYGGTQAGALSGMLASMTRVNGIYETEVSVRMILIPNDTLLIYLNAATDPYTNNNGSTMLSQNQTNVDAVIGSANYDIGHVFSTGGGGVAYVGVPCGSSLKAGGVTGSSSPVADAYDVDYVAHEMGHQFGAFHTFNSTTGSCGGGNRSSTAAYEPGSGITIMAYAGICGTDDLAPHSIAYFHTYSFDQIYIYTVTGTGNACPTTTATGNNPPTVAPVGNAFTIPFQTPFTLTATGSDPDGDAVTYSWEEMDLGAAGAVNVPVGDAPIFRPFPPTTSSSRTFPTLSTILNNTVIAGEILPSYARTLKYRVTIRDNKIGGGGVMHDDTALVRVNVINTSTAFAITSPNTAVNWFVGQQNAVNWNVSSSNLSPINCPNVKISLSTDGGNTFPIVLLASTPNDGTEMITVPNNITSQARIKVEAVGNIFFDISNSNFSIQPSAATLSLIYTDAVSSTTLCAGQVLNLTFAINSNANAGNIFTAQLSDASGSFLSPVAIGTLTSTTAGTITATIPSGTIQGSGYRIRIVSSAPNVTGSDNGTNLTILNTVSAAGVISGTSTVCQGQAGVIYSISPVTNATTYAWTLPTGASITGGANTNLITVTFSSSAVAGTITVVPSNACSTGTTSPGFSLAISALPSTAGVITGSANVCQGQTVVAFSVPAISNATGYNWVLPSGASITTGANTRSITVSFNSTAISGTISVNGTNTCGNGTASSFTVYVSPLAVPPVIAVNGGAPATFCSGGSVTLSVNSPLVTNNYQWRKNGVNISGATSTSYSANLAASYDVLTSFIPVPKQTLTNSNSISIPDNSCVGGSSTIVVSGYNAPVQTSKIYIKFSITHTFVGDLVLILEAPNGDHLGITNQTGNANNGGQNFTNTVIADSGTIIIPTTGAPYTALYKPNSTLFTNCATTTVSSFGAIGGGAINPNGTWKLLAYDRFASDVGTITSFAITFPNSPASSCPNNSNAIAVSLAPTPAISNFSPISGAVGSTVTINGTGLTSVTAINFNGVAATTFNIINANQLTAVVPIGASTGLITLVSCTNVNTATNFTVPVTLNLKVFIQGFYNGNGTMVPIVSSTLTDTITVELHQPVSPYATVYSLKGVLNTVGLVSLIYPSAANGNSYYIVIRHRNALETWSKFPVAFTTYTSYDFSH